MKLSIIVVVVVSLICAVSCQLATNQQQSSQANVDLLSMIMAPQRRAVVRQPVQRPAFLRPITYPIVQRQQRPMFAPFNNMLTGAYLLDNLGWDTGFDFNFLE